MVIKKNEGSLDTHRGAGEASRAGGTRLTTVSLEDKEANWRDALVWGRWEGALEGQARRRGPPRSVPQGPGMTAEVEEGQEGPGAGRRERGAKDEAFTLYLRGRHELQWDQQGR